LFVLDGLEISVATSSPTRSPSPITLIIYFVGSGLTALILGTSGAWIAFVHATRFIAGRGIGGEYAAVNSAIDELIPALVPRARRHRGQQHHWFGALLANVGTFVLLNRLEPSIGWRIGFAIGPVLGLVIIVVRRRLPESPRWQVMHGRPEQAEESISFIEHEVEERSGKALPAVDDDRAIEINKGRTTATSRCCACCSGSTRPGRRSARP
jgi:MFS family permease